MPGTSDASYPVALPDGTLVEAASGDLRRVDPASATVSVVMHCGPAGAPVAYGDGAVGSYDTVYGRLFGYDPRDGSQVLSVGLPSSSPVAMTVSPEAAWVLNYEGTLTRIELG